MIANPIIQQMQPTPDSCSSTAIAMILGRPVEEIINEFHEAYKTTSMQPINYLASMKDLIVRRCYSDEWIDGTKEHVYLGIVPSLNLEATTHSVVFDCRDYLIIYDPNKGKPGKKYYTFEPQEVKNNPLAVMLKGYNLEVEFIT